MVPADRHARTDQRESPDKIEPALAAEPIENTEATEPTEPIERIEPAEPMDKIEPAEPMDKIDPLDPMLSSEPADPLERGEPSAVCMRAFSQPSPISGRRARSSWATTWWTASTGAIVRGAAGLEGNWAGLERLIPPQDSKSVEGKWTWDKHRQH